MRWWPLLLVLALAPLASAQTAASDTPALGLDPARQDAAPGETVRVALVLYNPTSTATTWKLTHSTSSHAGVKLEREEVVVPPNARERVDATIVLPDAVDVTHVILFEAHETAASAQAGGRDTPMGVRNPASIRVPPPPDARAPVELRVDPARVDVPAGGSASARLSVSNPGPRIDAPDFEFKPVAGYLIRLREPPASLPANGRVDLEIVVTEEAPHRADAVFESAVGLRGHGAAATFRVRALTPPPTLPAAATPAIGDPTVPVGDAPTPPPYDTPPPLPDLEDPRFLAAAAMGSLGLGWSALWLTRRKWWPLLLALYTRLRPSRILDHPVRKRIAEAVQAEPGITFGDLARRVGIAPGQLTHHARMLEKAGVVFSSPDGQTRRFFHVGHGRIQAVPPLAERALALARERPRKASDLARELGVSRQALHYHLKALAAEGRLVTRADGRELWVEAAPAQPSSVAARVPRA